MRSAWGPASTSHGLRKKTCCNCCRLQCRLPHLDGCQLRRQAQARIVTVHQRHAAQRRGLQRVA